MTFDIANLCFKLPESFISDFKNKQPEWGPLGYITYKRTYSRVLPDGSTEEFWQTLKRVVEGTFSIQKNHCKKNHLPWDEHKAQRSAKRMYQLMWDFKFLPPGRGLWMMGTEYVARSGASSLNNCFSYETEIITSRGIKQIGDVSGTKQTILTTGGKWVEAPIKSFGEQKLWNITLSRSGVKKTIRTTANHRWFAIDRRKAYRNKEHSEFKTTELRPGIHRLEYVFGQGIKNVKPSPFGIAHGFAFGDGTNTPGGRNANCVNLFGSKDQALERFFALCPRSDVDNGVRFGAIPNFFKSTPSIEENKAYLMGWLMGYLAADGSVAKSGQITIASYSLDNLLFVRDVCSVLGIGTYSITEEERVTQFSNGIVRCYKINLMASTLTKDFFLVDSHKNNFKEDTIKQNWLVESVEETNDVEEVYCATVDGYGKFALADNILTGNCGFTTTENLDKDFSEPFCFLMDMSMLGVGIGFDTKGSKAKYTLNKPTGDTVVMEIADTREGWVDALRALLNSYYLPESYPITFSYDLIRKAGQPIKGFGGVASGPEPLKEMLEDIRIILDDVSSREATLSSVEITDIMNLIGRCVVAGNVRRSAEIAFSDITDMPFITMKQDMEKLIHHRWSSNNSVFCDIGSNYENAALNTMINGEPGYFWLDNARAYGRMVDPKNWKDMLAVGCNPCSEQTLHDKELCCLVETFPARHETLEEYLETLKLAYLYAKTVTLVPTHYAPTNSVMLKNRRIGLSQSGIIRAMVKSGFREHLRWCDEGYQFIQGLDTQYSNWLGIPRSIKTTSVKPSGSVSLLPGEPPGIHYPHSEYYIRRIRLSNNSPLIPIVQSAGYKVEVAVGQEASTVVVEFPIQEKDFAKSKDDVSIWEQVANVAAMQKYWADNQVSVTVTFRKEEAKDIKRVLEVYEDQLKSISFLPLSEHGYIQAPYETITKEQYEEMTQNLTKLQIDNKTEGTGTKFCDGDVCTI